MALITPPIREAAEKAKIWILATVNEDGTPRSIPIHFKKVLSDDTVLLMDNYMNTTLANLKARPDKVTVSFWEGGVHHLAGHACIETTGQIYESGVQMVHSEREGMPAKSAVIVKVTSSSSWQKP